MGTKTDPGRYDCLASAMTDEPLFVLLARDPAAPHLLETWASGRLHLVAAGLRPLEDVLRAEEAYKTAAAMREWRVKNDGAWRNRAASSCDLPPPNSASADEARAAQPSVRAVSRSGMED